jgi:hypothetical protein
MGKSSSGCWAQRWGCQFRRYTITIKPIFSASIQFSNVNKKPLHRAVSQQGQGFHVELAF